MCETLKLLRWVLLVASGSVIAAFAIPVVAADETDSQYLAAQVKLLTAENQRLKEQLKQALDWLAKLEERVARLEGPTGKPMPPAPAIPPKDAPAPVAPIQPGQADKKADDKALAAHDAVVNAIREYKAEMARIEKADELTHLQRQQAETAAHKKVEVAVAGKKLTFTCKVDDVYWTARYGAVVRFRDSVLKTSEGEVSEIIFHGPSALRIQATEQETAAIAKGSAVIISATLTKNPTDLSSGGDYGITILGWDLYIKLSDVTINGKGVRVRLSSER